VCTSVCTSEDVSCNDARTRRFQGCPGARDICMSGSRVLLAFSSPSPPLLLRLHDSPVWRMSQCSYLYLSLFENFIRVHYGIAPMEQRLLDNRNVTTNLAERGWREVRRARDNNARISITRENIHGSEACSRIKRVIIKYGTLNSIVYPHVIPWKIHFSPNLKTPSGPLNIICYRVCYFLLFHLLLAIFRVPSFLA